MRKSFIPIMFVVVAAMFSCNGKGEQSSLSNGSVWQNGSEVYVAEDSSSYWHLWGGTLHEGGMEMKLMQDGKWLVPAIADNQPTDSVAGTWALDGNTIVLTANDRTQTRLEVIGGLHLASRNEMEAKALPALDSIQQIGVYRQLEGVYRDQSGRKWTFSGNTVRRKGLGTEEKYAVGKSLDMNDSVIFTDNIAYAFRLKEGEVQLYKAEYVDTADVWKYKFEGKPLETLKKVAQ